MILLACTYTQILWNNKQKICNSDYLRHGRGRIFTEQIEDSWEGKFSLNNFIFLISESRETRKREKVRGREKAKREERRLKRLMGKKKTQEDKKKKHEEMAVESN